MMEPSTVIGSIGVALLLLAFLLNLLKRLPQESTGYAALNVVGAGLACYASWMISFIPFVVLEGTWCLVAVIALARSLAGGADSGRHR